MIQQQSSLDLISPIAARDYTLIIDKSGSMSAVDRDGGKTRWETVKESTLALARKCEEYDDDGITVYLFSNRFQRYLKCKKRTLGTA
jgi:hypothetical protein